MSKRLKNGFIPHKENNYRPNAIRHTGLAFALFLFLTLQLIYNFTSSGTVQVLGYATNVTEAGLLDYTNQNRESAGLDELYINEKLNQAAQAKAEHMASNDYWAHYAPDGTTPWSFINATGYEYLKAGENLAYGFSDSAGTVKGWMNSEPHKANILDAKFAEVGFGVASSPTFQGDENTIIVAMYGQPITAVAGRPGEVTSQNENLSWTPQQAVKAEQSGDVAIAAQSEDVNLFTAVVTGQAHWGIYASLAILMTLAIVFAMRHLVALHQLATKGEHYIEGHPMIEAGLIYGLLWLTLASRYGVVG